MWHWAPRSPHQPVTPYPELGRDLTDRGQGGDATRAPSHWCWADIARLGEMNVLKAPRETCLLLDELMPRQPLSPACSVLSSPFPGSVQPRRLHPSLGLARLAEPQHSATGPAAELQSPA